MPKYSLDQGILKVSYLADIQTTFTILSAIAIVGFLLNFVASKLLMGTGRIARLKIVAILKAFINLGFIVSWATFLFGYPLLSIPLFFITGFLLILLSYILFSIVHDQVFVRRGSEFVLITPVGILLLQQVGEVVQQYKDIISNVYAIGLGFMLGINFLTVIYAYQLYQEMRGGAAIWLMIATYTGALFLVSIMGVLATFYNISGILSDIDSFIVSTSPLILPDIIMLTIGLYYKREVLPLIQKLAEEVKA